MNVVPILATTEVVARISSTPTDATVHLDITTANVSLKRMSASLIHASMGALASMEFTSEFWPLVFMVRVLCFRERSSGDSLSNQIVGIRFGGDLILYRITTKVPNVYLV